MPFIWLSTLARASSCCQPRSSRRWPCSSCQRSTNRSALIFGSCSAAFSRFIPSITCATRSRPESSVMARTVAGSFCNVERSKSFMPPCTWSSCRPASPIPAAACRGPASPRAGAGRSTDRPANSGQRRPQAATAPAPARPAGRAQAPSENDRAGLPLKFYKTRVLSNRCGAVRIECINT